LSRFLFAELKSQNVTYPEFAKRLRKSGWGRETRASVANKLSRGAFSASFFFATLEVLGVDYIDCDEIRRMGDGEDKRRWERARARSLRK
jgi:hypothetical protein